MPAGCIVSDAKHQRMTHCQSLKKARHLKIGSVEIATKITLGLVRSVSNAPHLLPPLIHPIMSKQVKIGNVWNVMGTTFLAGLTVSDVMPLNPPLGRSDHPTILNTQVTGSALSVQVTTIQSVLIVTDALHLNLKMTGAVDPTLTDPSLDIQPIHRIMVKPRYFRVNTLMIGYVLTPNVVVTISPSVLIVTNVKQ